MQGSVSQNLDYGIQGVDGNGVGHNVGASTFIVDDHGFIARGITYTWWNEGRNYHYPSGCYYQEQTGCDHYIQVGTGPFEIIIQERH